MKNFSLIFLFAISFSCASIAQTEEINNLDNKYSPPGGSVFYDSKSESSEVSSARSAILLEPCLVPRGIIGASYLRQVGKSRLSVKGTLGYVASIDFVHTFLGTYAVIESGNSEVNLTDLYYESSYYQGKRFFGQFSFHLDINHSNGLNGGGFEAGIRLHNQSIAPAGSINGYNINEEFINIQSKTFFLHWSNIFVSTKRLTPVVQQISFGFGYKSTSFDELDNDNSPDESYTKTGNMYAFENVTFQATYSLGLGW